MSDRFARILVFKSPQTHFFVLGFGGGGACPEVDRAAPSLMQSSEMAGLTSGRNPVAGGFPTPVAMTPGGNV
jgi:hypothetical protein